MNRPTNQPTDLPNPCKQVTFSREELATVTPSQGKKERKKTLFCQAGSYSRVAWVRNRDRQEREGRERERETRAEFARSFSSFLDRLAPSRQNRRWPCQLWAQPILCACLFHYTSSFGAHTYVRLFSNLGQRKRNIVWGFASESERERTLVTKKVQWRL